MKRLRHILQSKHLIKIITIIIFIITLLYTNYYPFKSKYTKDDKKFIGIVTKYEVKEDKIKSVDEFCLPGTDMKRNVIIVEKIKETPKKYPRKAGTPAKQPLK